MCSSLLEREEAAEKGRPSPYSSALDANPSQDLAPGEGRWFPTWLAACQPPAGHGTQRRAGLVSSTKQVLVERGGDMMPEFLLSRRRTKACWGLFPASE